MARYIDAEALKLAPLDPLHHGNAAYAVGWNAALDMINDAPTCDVEPVRHGRWGISEYEYLDCSVCGRSYYTGCSSSLEAIRFLAEGRAYKGCPHCRAKMDGGNDDGR